jgi:predicted DNA-binding transcriptional regulator AlpA
MNYRKQCQRCGATITAFGPDHCDPCAVEISQTMEKLGNPPSYVAKPTLAEKLGIVHPPELAIELGVSEATLQLWRQNGNGPPFVKMGKNVLYRVSDVHRWLENNITDRVRERTTTEVPPVSGKVTTSNITAWTAPVVKVDERYPLLEGSTDER